MIRYSKKNTVIHYKKGMTNEDAIKEIENRMRKRMKELDKRQWIVDEYNSLKEKQEVDREWIGILKRNEVILNQEQ